MTTIRIVIAGQQVTAQLDDNPTARALAGQLPLTLSFRDLNSVEKISKLPQPLTTEGVPDVLIPRSRTSATTRLPKIWFSTTATSATGTASCESAGSTTGSCCSWRANPTGSKSRSNVSDRQRISQDSTVCDAQRCASAQPITRSET